jgi:hypothetical protein
MTVFKRFRILHQTILCDHPNNVTKPFGTADLAHPHLLLITIDFLLTTLHCLTPKWDIGEFV